MTVTVGTDVYLTVAEADAYWAAKNNADWSDATTPEKEKALIEATQYIDGAYSFIGRQNTDNILAWPRYEAYVERGNFAGVTYDSSTIPTQIKQACAELAIEALTSRLAATQDRGGLIKREKTDVLETEYMDFAPSGKSYNFVSMLLKPLLRSSGIMKPLVRC